MFLDARRSEFFHLHRSIPLIYAPYLGAEAFRVYVVYVALAGSEGHAEVSEGDICRFLGIDIDTLKEAHAILESHRLVQIKKETGSSSDFLCTLLPPPPLAEEHEADFAARTLPVETGAILPKPVIPRRPRRSPTLTPARLISKFYRAIHRPRIDPDEREMAKAEIAELRANYSLEQIDQAIQWTVANQDVLLQPVESFAIIRDTIDQALAAQERSEMKKSHAQASAALEEQEIRKQQELVREVRKNLTPEQLADIHERALAQIESDPSIAKELVTDTFIRVQEDAIILEEYVRDTFEPG